MSALPPITELLTWHTGEDRPPVVLPCDLPDGYRMELLHRYEEPRFTNLVGDVFFSPTGTLRWPALGLREDVDLQAFRRAQMVSRPTLRLAVRHGDELVGWSFGYADNPDGLYMASSAVLEGHRRRGLYRAMAQMMLSLARQGGFHFVHSRHVTTNNPILIAKLSLGFRIIGLELSPEIGTLLSMEYPLSEVREHVLLARSGLTRMRPELAAALGPSRG